MLSIKGKYENGVIKFSKKLNLKKNMEVIVTFLDDETDNKENIIDTKVFSFNKSQKILEKYKGNFSDDVIEERRSYL